MNTRWKILCRITKGKRLCITSFLLAFFAVSCKTIPEYAPETGISQPGAPGDVLSTVRLGVGYLVETARLKENQFVNLQVNEEDPIESEPFAYPHTLTIGRFSKIWGSGFTRSENIFYRKRISENGKDFFEVNGNHYRVEWQGIYDSSDTSGLPEVYIITFRPAYEQST